MGHSGEQVNTFDFLETTPKNLNRGRRLRRVPFREVAQKGGLRTSAQSATKRLFKNGVGSQSEGLAVR